MPIHDYISVALKRDCPCEVCHIRSLVAQFLLGHHHLHDVPEGFALHLLALFGDMADRNASDLSQVLGGELKGVGGTAAERHNKQQASQLDVRR